METCAAWNFHLRPTRWCVLISGRGSNLAALLEQPTTDVRLVVSSDAAAAGCAKARRAGVPVLTIPRREEAGEKNRTEKNRTEKNQMVRKIDWTALDQILRAHSIDAIFLLGFMRIVPAHFIDAWSGRILNLHPSLLPKYPGLNSIERSYEAFDDCGVTVHTVVADVDAGPIHASRLSLSKNDARRFELAAVETNVHIDEQRLVKQMAEVWRPGGMK